MSNQTRLCKCAKNNNQLTIQRFTKYNSCTNEITSNTIPFLLSLKYDIMRQEDIISKIQSSIIIHDDTNDCHINNILKFHMVSNNHTIDNINAYLKCICKHIIVEDYIETGVENMMKITYCKICELTFS